MTQQDMYLINFLKQYFHVTFSESSTPQVVLRVDGKIMHQFATFRDASLWAEENYNPEYDEVE